MSVASRRVPASRLRAAACAPRKVEPITLVTQPEKQGNILFHNSGRRENPPVFPKGRTRLHLLTLVNQLTRTSALAGFWRRGVPLPSLAFLSAITLFESSKKGDAYNILWALVFGFATLNILSLVAKRFEPDRNRVSFGEMLAIGTVIVAVILLGWEMLYLFKILPIRLGSH